MIPIVFSTDHNYIMPTGVTIASLLMSAEESRYDIYVLISSDVTPEDKEKLSKQVALLSSHSKISFIEMGDKFEDGFEIRGISKACYYRLMIPWLLPDIDKIIYCDVDIIFNASLKDLYEIDLGDNYVAGAYPCEIEVWKNMCKYFNKIGLKYDEYINSGVLLINSKEQRAKGLDKVYDELSKRKFLYQDQDIINIACKGHILFFDKKYNLKPSLYATSPDLYNNVVLHYAGEKPWVTFTFAWAEWWEVYKKSIFKDDKLYHDVSARILSVKYQFKSFKRKAIRKIQVLARKF